MKIVIQRCQAAQVMIENKVFSQISAGMLLLVCLEKGDSQEVVNKAVEKIQKIRLFECPEKQKMDLNVIQAKKEIMAISQFTLSWDGQKGNRPGFENSLDALEAKVLFSYFVERLKEKSTVQTGDFGKHMSVSLINDGPVTFSLNFN